MQVHFGVDSLRLEWPGSVVCLGTFDGVHLGHQEVIQAAVGFARTRGLPPVLVTFDRHPASVLVPDRCPPAIAPLEDNLKMFERLGVGIAVVLAFDRALSHMEADEFWSTVLLGALHCKGIVIGHDFAFGHDRKGTPEWLKQHVETQVVPPFEVSGRRVSSSAIRQAIADGEIHVASKLLGRPFAISGVIVQGEQVGRTIGYPTANLARAIDQVVPANGVYAGIATTPYGSYRAAIGIGVRPTFGDFPRTIEAFLLDYPGESLYGTTMRLEIHHRIRNEIAFKSVEELRDQMARDVEFSRQVEM